MKNIVAALLVLLSLHAISQPSEEIDLSAIKANILSSNIIILGEVHDDYEAKEYYPSLIAQIQKIDVRYNCLALEFPEHVHHIFENLVYERQSYQNACLEFHRRIFPITTESDLEMKCNENTIFKYVLESWVDGAKTMKKSGGAFFSIDHPKSNEFKFNKGIRKRNAYMSQRVISLLTEKKCSKVIMINGGGHIDSRYSRNLLSRLKKQSPFGIFISSQKTPSCPPPKDGIFLNPQSGVIQFSNPSDVFQDCD